MIRSKLCKWPVVQRLSTFLSTFLPTRVYIKASTRIHGSVSPVPNEFSTAVLSHYAIR